MNAYCHSCAERVKGNCNANEKTYEKKIIKPFECPEYKRALVKDAVTTDYDYGEIMDMKLIYEKLLRNMEITDDQVVTVVMKANQSGFTKRGDRNVSN